MGEGAVWPWVTAAVALISALSGGLLRPLLDGGNERAKRGIEVADRLRDDLAKQLDDMRSYAARVEAQAETIKRENARLFSSLVTTLASFNEFKNLMIQEAVALSVLIDAQDMEGASRRADSLLKNIRALQITIPPWGGE